MLLSARGAIPAAVAASRIEAETPVRRDFGVGAFSFFFFFKLERQLLFNGSLHEHDICACL